jgi:hypothetical protein
LIQQGARDRAAALMCDSPLSFAAYAKFIQRFYFVAGHVSNRNWLGASDIRPH